MVAAGYHFDPLIDAAPASDTIDQPMLAGNAARPPAGEVALQRFWLAETGEWSAACIFDQFVDSAMSAQVVL